MKIKNVTINSKLCLAPMAGVTDLAFRTICRELGAGYTVTEMVSAKALCYQDRKSVPLLELGDGEHPAAAQIFGSDEKCMEEAAAYFGIGINKLREMTNEDNCPFVLWNGSKRMIKRKAFEKFLEAAYSI